MPDDYARHYTEDSLWRKLGGFARVAGRELVEKALVLYYVGTDPATPAWAKGIIGAALGYFVFPLDAIPDLAPFIGYTDDLGAIVFALAALGASVKHKHFDLARQKVRQWFDGAEAPIEVPPNPPPAPPAAVPPILKPPSS